MDQHKGMKVTKDHSLFDVDIEKDIECKEHPDECVRFFCEPCETCICVLCTFNEHKVLYKFSKLNHLLRTIRLFSSDVTSNLPTFVYDVALDIVEPRHLMRLGVKGLNPLNRV